MAKKMYIGINGISKEVKRIYAGVENIARKVTKGYIGIAGIARQFFSGEELSYYGVISPLKTARKIMAPGKIGDYALFAGGETDYSSSGMLSTVDSYSISLAKGTPTSLSVSRYDPAHIYMDSYMLFAGGGGYNTASNVVDAYNSSLTRSTSTIGANRACGAGASVNGYGIHSGGELYGTGRTDVYAFSSNLTRSTLSALNAGVTNHIGGNVGNYALFGGGTTDGSTASSSVTAYNSSLVKSTPSALSSARRWWYSDGAGNLENYCIFWGGTTDVYDKSLVKITPPSNTNVSRCVSANNKVYGQGGGKIVIIDENLVKSTTEFKEYTNCNTVSSIGNFILFAGCYTSSQVSNVVTAYTIS